jgi:hypothetical protein
VEKNFENFDFSCSSYVNFRLFAQHKQRHEERKKRYVEKPDPDAPKHAADEQSRLAALMLAPPEQRRNKEEEVEHEQEEEVVPSVKRRRGRPKIKLEKEEEQQQEMQVSIVLEDVRPAGPHVVTIQEWINI